MCFTDKKSKANIDTLIALTTPVLLEPFNICSVLFQVRGGFKEYPVGNLSFRCQILNIERWLRNV